MREREDLEEIRDFRRCIGNEIWGNWLELEIQ